MKASFLIVLLRTDIWTQLNCSSLSLEFVFSESLFPNSFVSCFFFLLLMTEFSTVFFVPSIVVAVFAATHIFPVVLLPTGSACVSVCRAFAWWVG